MPAFAMPALASRLRQTNFAQYLDLGASIVHALHVAGFTQATKCGCSSVVEHLLAKERVESSNLFIRFFIPG